MADASNLDQQEFWTSIAGPKWIAHQEALDHLMQPVLDDLWSRTGLRAGHRVLDIGCGTGAATLQAAGQVGDSGHVTGVDISAPMLDLAQVRAGDVHTASFIEADATVYPFEAGQYDHLISRFGVMFFANSEQAFANMAKALKTKGRINFAAWGQIPNNPFFTLPARVAREVLGAPPKPDPDAPGPFAFRDPDRVLGILNSAGLQGATCDVVQMDLTPKGTPLDCADMSMSIGPVESACTHFNATATQRADIHAALVDAYAALDTKSGVRIPAEINFFAATAA